MNGIKFGNYHSYDNLNLILSEVKIPPAQAKTNYIDIPGADGSIDLTEALGDVKYQDRDCSFTFTALPTDDFEEKKTEVSNLLNGQRFHIILDKDPDYYWDGRCSVNGYESDRNLHKIVVNAKVKPYKMRITPISIDVQAGSDVAVILTNGRKKAIPTFVCQGGTTVVTFNGNGYTFTGNGSFGNLDIALVEGENNLSITADTAVTITYERGDL